MYTKTEINGDNFDEVLAKIKSNDRTITSIKTGRVWLDGDKEKGTERVYNMPKDKIIEFLGALKGNTRVVKLSLFELETAGVWFGNSLGDMLIHNDTIADLNVTSSEFNSVSLQSFSEGLALNTGVRKLVLTHNDLINVKPLAKALEVNKGLLDLVIDFNQLSDDDAVDLAQALEKNTSLLRFSFPDSKIGKKGVDALLTMLKTNKSINCADFKHIGKKSTRREIYGKETLKKLCEVLKNNESLIDIDLSYTDFCLTENDDVRMLAKALNDNKSLMSINLGTIGLNLARTNVLLGMQKSNTHLATIDFGYNVDQYIYTDVQDERREKEVFLRNVNAIVNKNKNFLGSSCVISSCSLHEVLSENKERAEQLIDKIENERVKLTVEEVEKIQELMPAIVEILKNRNNSIYNDRKFVTPVLEMAIEKAKKVKVGLKVPSLYRAYLVSSYVEEHRIKPKKPKKLKKLDFSSLNKRISSELTDMSACEIFASVSARRKYPVSYHAGLTGQLGELITFLEEKNGTLNKDDLLFQPSEKEARLIDFIVEDGLLSKVMTVNNWRNDPAGLDDVLAHISPAQIHKQLEEKLPVEDLKSHLLAKKIKQGRSAIKIG